MMQEQNKFTEVGKYFFIVFIVLGFLLWTKFGAGIPVSVSSITTARPTPFTVTAEGKVTAKPSEILSNQPKMKQIL